jgi:AraC-like DNA-binding protein
MLADPIGQMISLAGPRDLIWKQLEAAGTWGIRFPANDGVVFAYVVSGSCAFEAYGQSRVLEAGDFVLLVRPPNWVLSSRSGVVPIDYSPERRSIARLDRRNGPQTRTVGGRFVLDGTSVHLLRELLPPLVVMRTGDDGAARVRQILGLLRDEAGVPRTGQSFAVEQLMGLLLVEAVRSPRAGIDAGRQPALLRAFADPQIARALQFMHGDVARRWTVEELAARVGMSRSSFAEHFTAVLGLPPIDYLLDWRMVLAKRRLRDEHASLSEIAEAVGYRSASAFSTAFHRRVGCPPSVFAKRGTRT